MLPQWVESAYRGAKPKNPDRLQTSSQNEHSTNWSKTASGRIRMPPGSASPRVWWRILLFIGCLLASRGQSCSWSDRLRSDVRRSAQAPLETSLTCKDLVSLQGIYAIPDLWRFSVIQRMAKDHSHLLWNKPSDHEPPFATFWSKSDPFDLWLGGRQAWVVFRNRLLTNSKIAFIAEA